jgi:hypothetical protein
MKAFYLKSYAGQEAEKAPWRDNRHHLTIIKYSFNNIAFQI